MELDFGAELSRIPSVMGNACKFCLSAPMPADKGIYLRV